MRRRGIAALLAVVALGLGASAAGAAPVSGGAGLTLSVGTAKQLSAAGVTLRAAAPAKLRGWALTLPVIDGQVADTATARLGGGLSLRRGSRSVVLRGLRVQADPGGAALSALLDGRRITLLTANTGRRLTLTGGTARLTSAPMTLTQRAASLIEERLTLAQASRRGRRAFHLPSGAFAGLTLQLSSSAATTSAPSTTGPATTTTADPSATDPAAGPAAPTAPAKPVAATRYNCPIPEGDTQGPVTGAPSPPGGLAATPTPSTPLPASGSLSWRLKQSFVAYVAGGGGTTSGGSFSGSGTYQQSGDRLVLDTSGSVVFCYPGHFFWIALSNPTITIDPAGGSRLTVTLETNQFGTEYGPWRVDLATLSSGTPTRSADNKTVTWSNVGATLTADGASAFGGLYGAGTALDPLTFSVSVPTATPPPAPPTTPTAPVSRAR